MKKISKLLSLFVATLVLVSCGGITKMSTNLEGVKYAVTPSPLEMHAGKVEISLTGTYPEKYFNKKAMLTVTPIIVDEAGTEIAAYEPITVQGEAVEGNNPVIKTVGGALPAYTKSVDYTEAMMKSELKIKCKGWISGKEDKTIDFVLEEKVTDGVIATPALVQNKPKAILMPDKFERTTTEVLEAEIHYLINRYEVRSNELRDEDVKDLVSKIKDAQKNERKEVVKAEISAYASPDGDLVKINTPLAKNRQGSAERYLKKEFARAKVKNSSEEFFNLMNTPEDWEGFKTLLQASDIQDKDLILRVLSMYDDPEVREKEIKNITAAFEEVKEKVLPELRRSKLAVRVDRTGYSDDELKELVDANPDTLNIEEILFAATLFDDMNKKLSIYQKAYENFPDDIRTINNVGFAQFALGQNSEAKASFEKAKAMEDIATVKNNIGAVTMVDGDTDAAEELFTAAMGAPGDAVNYNLGIIKIMKADYEAATNYFGSTTDFNAALAKILNGQSEAALNTLASIEDPSAMDYYLMAVAAARQDSEDTVYKNLRSAIGKDASLKDYAKKDLEFRKFLETDTFKSIVN